VYINLLIQYKEFIQYDRAFNGTAMYYIISIFVLWIISFCLQKYFLESFYKEIRKSLSNNENTILSHNKSKQEFIKNRKEREENIGKNEEIEGEKNVKKYKNSISEKNDILKKESNMINLDSGNNNMRKTKTFRNSNINLDIYDEGKNKIDVNKISTNNKKKIMNPIIEEEKIKIKNLDNKINNQQNLKSNNTNIPINIYSNLSREEIERIKNNSKTELNKKEENSEFYPEMNSSYKG